MNFQKHGGFQSLTTASLNSLRTCYKLLAGLKEHTFIFTHKAMDQLSSVTVTAQPVQRIDFQELKKEVIHKLSLNRIAYIGNSDLSDDWTDGYNQAIQDLERYLVIREWSYNDR